MPASARLNHVAAAVLALVLALWAALATLGRGEQPNASGAFTRVADAGALRGAPPLPQAVALPEARLLQFVGYYRQGDGQALSVRMVDGELMAWLDGPSWLRLVAVSSSRFAVDGSPTEIEFDARPQQRANAVALRERSNTRVLLRANDPVGPFAGVAFYLRGSMNDWRAVQPMQPAGAQQYVTTVSLPAGRHEFKLGSDDWQAIDFGAAASGEPVTPGRTAELARVGGNLVLLIERSGNYRFTLTANDGAAPTIAVTALP